MSKVKLTEIQKQVLDQIQAMQGQVTLKAIIEHTGVPRNRAYVALKALMQKGLVVGERVRG